MVNSVLLKAILSMDAYNRGYDAGIKFGTLSIKNQSLDDLSVQIGSATVLGNSTLAFGAGVAQAISFYGISYQLKDATGKVIDTIISYRGTDNLGVDLLAGYGVGGGNPKEAQAQMAFDFYNVVAGGGDPTKTNISLTGHSLGGGLAGLVGAVYGKSATLFDNMAFEGAAQNTKIFSDPASGSLYDAAFKQKVYGNLAPWNPTISSASNSLLQTYYTNGEFLAANRSAQQTPQHALDIGSGVTLPGVDSGLFGDNLHSIATLTILLYADASTGMGVPADWKNAAKYFWPVMYDDTFAAGIGNASSVLGTLHDSGKYSAIVRTAIAYSAIDEGVRLYGDTGIRALYNDANELGKALSLVGVSSALTANATDISKAFVQYAGQLALNKVLNTPATASVLDGVLKLADVANNHSITIDFTAGTWSKANNGSAPALIVARDSLIKDVLGASSNAVHAEMKRGWSDITAGTDPNAAANDNHHTTKSKVVC